MITCLLIFSLTGLYVDLENKLLARRHHFTAVVTVIRLLTVQFKWCCINSLKTFFGKLKYDRENDSLVERPLCSLSRVPRQMHCV